MNAYGLHTTHNYTDPIDICTSSFPCVCEKHVHKSAELGRATTGSCAREHRQDTRNIKKSPRQMFFMTDMAADPIREGGILCHMFGKGVIWPIHTLKKCSAHVFSEIRDLTLFISFLAGRLRRLHPLYYNLHEKRRSSFGNLDAFFRARGKRLCHHCWLYWLLAAKSR